MSDEEDSISEEGFSASEEEWTPYDKNTRHGRGHDGESSDDDDSDFEVIRKTNATVVASNSNLTKTKNESKSPNIIKTKTTIKKRKAAGQTLRAKLYNKYRPPPKTITSPTSRSPLASTSTSITVISKRKPISQKLINNTPKNLLTPNESNISGSNLCNEDGSSSDSSILEQYVYPGDIDLSRSISNQQSKIYENANERNTSGASTPIFDCNAGLENLNDSESETEINAVNAVVDKEAKQEKEELAGNEAEEDGSRDGEKYDFSNLLKNLNNVERNTEDIANINGWTKWTPASQTKNAHATDVLTMLTLGENLQKQQQYDDGEDEDDDDDDDDYNDKHNRAKNNAIENKNMDKSKSHRPISKLNKTKSTRIKRHIKVRPESIVGQSDSDDSEWEEVADHGDNILENTSKSTRNLEIVVELPTRQHKKNAKTKTQQDLELALKRKFNRERKERQLLMHKASLLCHFAHYYLYNCLLNDMKLIKVALKLLPSQNAYPTEKGTEIKYFESLAKWYKTVITLEATTPTPTKPSAATGGEATSTTSANAYKLLSTKRKLCNKSQVQDLLMRQIVERKAICQQHMIYILIILLRGMGLQCRLIVNLQPIAFKPPPEDLISIQLKPDNNKNTTSSSKETKSKAEERVETGEKKIAESNHKKTIQAQSKLKPESTIANNCPEDNNEGDKTNQSVLGKNVKAKVTKGKTNENNSADVKHFAEGVISETISTISKQIRSKAKNSKNNALLNKSETVLKTAATVNTNVDRQEDPSQPTTIITSTPPTTDLNITTKKRIHNDQNVCSPEPTNKIKRTQNDKVQLRDNNVEQRKQSEKENAEVVNNVNSKLALMSNKTNNKKDKSKNKPTSAPTIFTEPGHSRTLRSKMLNPKENITKNKSVPQLDGGNDVETDGDEEMICTKSKQAKQNKQLRSKRPNLAKLQANKCTKPKSDEDFEPSPPKKVKSAPTLKRRNNRQVLSPDENADGHGESRNLENSLEIKRKRIPNDVWVEVWCDVEEQWICLDLFTTKMHCIESIKKFASHNLAYVYAFQNDLSIKDVTARYCTNWTDTVRKCRVDKNWLDTALDQYIGQRTMRDIKEDQELRRIHEEKPMPTTISDYKNHPFYALERHLLKFEAIYPPDAPTLGYVRNEAVYSRDCVHKLHSRDIWLKQARVVKLGEKPYKIVKARPKWDRLTQTVIKDQPLEIFGYWQTQDYEPPTAENGLVPRNAYGNVELFKPTMLPKKTKHLRLPGLNRICKKLGIDCANAVIGFDFHQGVCHPLLDGFVVCEEFADQVTAAWHQDQEEQERKEQEKWEARVYGNWKKLIRGLLIRERLKVKYNF